MIFRIKVGGWGIGDKLISEDMNNVDINTTYALDKRAGQTDTLASVVQATGIARTVDTIATGPDRDWAFHYGGSVASATSARTIRVPTLTAARTYALGVTCASVGDRMLFYYDGTGGSASGYVDINNNVGTGLARFGPAMSAADAVNRSTVEVIFGATGWMPINSARTCSRTYTSNGTWTCPPGVFEVLLIGYGGGGGGHGSGGGTAFTGSSYTFSGGGGGGGSAQHTRRVRVEPGTTYAISIGAGGTGGNGGVGGTSTASAATDGGTTSFGTLASFPGAARGGPGAGLAASAGALTWGGDSVANGIADDSRYLLSAFASIGTGVFAGFMSMARMALPPGKGGFGSVFLVATGSSHGSNGWGYTGGTGAPAGIGTGTYLGGGPGGGGAAGPGGNGGAGGRGGIAAPGGTSTGMVAGTAAAANTGAGGGGGGAPGTADVGSNGTTGGSGGSGQLTIIWVQ